MVAQQAGRECRWRISRALPLMAGMLLAVPVYGAEPLAAPARSVETVLVGLNDARATGSVGDLEVVLHLKSGRDLTGRLMDVKTEAGTRAVLLQSTGNMDADFALVYVALDSVEAVTLRKAQALARLPVLASPPTTKNELLKKAEDLAKRLSTMLGSSTAFEVQPGALDRDGLQRLSDGLWRANRALVAMAGDELGRQELKKIRRVVVLPGVASASAEQEVLTIHIPTGDSRMPSVDELKRLIENAL